MFKYRERAFKIIWKVSIQNGGEQSVVVVDGYALFQWALLATEHIEQTVAHFGQWIPSFTPLTSGTFGT